MIISKEVALLLRIISTAPAMATKLFSKRHRFLQGGVRCGQGVGGEAGEWEWVLYLTLKGIIQPTLEFANFSTRHGVGGGSGDVSFTDCFNQ